MSSIIFLIEFGIWVILSMLATGFIGLWLESWLGGDNGKK